MFQSRRRTLESLPRSNLLLCLDFFRSHLNFSSVYFFIQTIHSSKSPISICHTKIGPKEKIGTNPALGKSFMKKLFFFRSIAPGSISLPGAWEKWILMDPPRFVDFIGKAGIEHPQAGGNVQLAKRETRPSYCFRNIIF
jgi:hypothetical protein